SESRAMAKTSGFVAARLARSRPWAPARAAARAACPGGEEARFLQAVTRDDMSSSSVGGEPGVSTSLAGTGDRVLRQQSSRRGRLFPQLERPGRLAYARTIRSGRES